ncbi:hypothetical protein RKE29_12190 [Streptomyces sp. B1866]|uniref:alpha/beta fold hydrolase n=1 Tax=Streptomyces sp. B1866 TaxID=3075431 RepID=UPI0028921B75|nr:hypothetical protein [Streptomyces sp. B1866]MDT3397398.1 hypothetical protein [Streptomyces sp. B1866]
MRTDRITVDGIGTVLRRAGPPDAAAAVVYLHGNPGPGADWDGVRAVAWDAPGFGRADKPDGFPHTVPAHAG